MRTEYTLVYRGSHPPSRTNWSYSVLFPSTDADIYIHHYVGPYHDDWDKSLALVEFAIKATIPIKSQFRTHPFERTLATTLRRLSR